MEAYFFFFYGLRGGDHMLEIIGYPILKETEAGYEADEVVRQFISVATKVMQKFRRLKCRACGHLLFTNKTSGFNTYNKFACTNPGCAEYGNSIYLNYCFHCKTGLIDSRDSKQCPNGWYICPSCLACCNDEQYERQAQRYELSGRPIPPRIQRMLGHGHNNQGIYYCFKCGNQMEGRVDDSGRTFSECPNCHLIKN